MSTKLSVIIPCYNFEKYLEEAVDSVLKQVVDFSMEILIIDDCSTDNTFKLINDRYGSKSNVKIFQSPKNRGVTKNLKDMLDKSTGEYVMTLDGDDYIVDNEYLQRAVGFLDNDRRYSMFCSGYRWLNNDGTMEPKESIFVSTIEDVTLNDLLSINHITVGRVFRNYKNIIKPWVHDDLHEDWCINAEILKNGMAKCERRFSSVYRITKSGRITSLTEEQIQEKNIRTISAIKANLETKVITIVDSFVYNDTIRDKLAKTLGWMKEDGHEVLLVSNTTVDKDILKNVKFYLYDSRNQLFNEKYDVGGVVDFWKVLSDEFQLHDVVPEMQKHGLSVLINLFNAISYAKQQGYTHFQRFEVDDLFGEKSREHIRRVPTLCGESGKRGLFYYNEEKNTPDISFHYFYCNIDDFLNKIPRISREQDYLNYLTSTQGNKAFKIVEVFVYENLKKHGDSDFLTKKGTTDMYSDFSDTHWNTETSVSSFDSKYGKCTTRLYHINEYNRETQSYSRGSSYIVYTHSYTSEETVRSILVEKTNGESFRIEHRTSSAGGWAWHEIPSDTKSITVFQNNNLMYKEHVSECISYINIKR